MPIEVWNREQYATANVYDSYYNWKHALKNEI